MSKELQMLQEELQGYQRKCADLEDIVAILEREIFRLTNSLASIQGENRKLAAMVLGQSSPKPEPGDVAPQDKEEDKKQEPNDESSTGDESTPDGDENPFADNTGECEKECQCDDDEEIDFDKFPPGEEKEQKPKFKNYKEKITYECQKFLSAYSFTAFCDRISKDILGQESELKKFLAVLYNYIRTLSEGERPDKCNTIILTAPSGNGKSALVKSLAEFFSTEIPSLVCSRKDASRLTPEGYRGTTVNSILSDFAPYNKWDIEQRYGILWLDEFDKVRFNHDGGPQVTAQLLTLMDGHKEKHGNIIVDTNYILWVVSGSFNEIRYKKQLDAEKTIGFANKNQKYDMFDEITRSDMLQLFSPEIVGRFNLVVSFKRLSDKDVALVIAKTLEDICKNLQLEAVLSEAYINTLTKSANSEFGCRQIYSSLYETCLQAYIEILQSYGIEENPLVIIEGPDNYTILDDLITDQIEYKNIDEE